MKKSISFTLLLFFTFYCSIAQKLALEDLQTICNNKNFEATNKLLLTKNYEFSKTEKTDDNTNIISWTFDQLLGDKSKNIATFIINSQDGNTKKAIYKFRGKEIYANILNELTKFAYRRS